MKPTRETIKQFIGKKVKVTFEDNEVIEGVLRIGNDSIWWHKNKYYIMVDPYNTYWFRVSHIKNIKEMNNDRRIEKEC